MKEAPWVRVVALAATLAVMAFTFALPSLDTIDQERPPVVQAWIAALLIQWTLLSLVVTVRLWRAGVGQPSVARKRMRLLSLGALGLAIALIIAGTVPASEEPRAIDLVVSLLATLTAASFFLGFAPPAAIRTVWRRPEVNELNEAITGLMAARTPREIEQRLLPRVVDIVGARGAALLTPDGNVIGSEGVSSSMMQEISLASPEALREEIHSPRLVVLPFEFGSLVAWGSPYTPFFGREEVDLVRSLGTLTDIALERASLFEREQQARTGLERANEELARKEAQLAEAQEISQIGSWEWDIQADSIEWSDELTRIFGLEPRGAPSNFEGFLSHIHIEDVPLVREAVERSLASGESFDVEFRGIRADGTVRTIHGTGRLMAASGGRPGRMIGVAQDITERKESERALADAFSRERLARVGAERASNELEQFVYSVSHDLNNPLVAILGYLDYLEKDHGPQLAEAGRFYIERMKHSAGFMQSLIKDLLELSRVGRSQTETEQIDLERLIRDIASEIGATNPQVEVEMQDLPAVQMNPVRARQLFANLMQNSVKYADRPDVLIRVEKTDETPDGFVHLSVADNGPGIPPDKRERVFRVFERLDTTKDGSGIGLAVCKRIVETHGGRIWIEDTEGGTDMRVAVPPAPGEGRG